MDFIVRYDRRMAFGYPVMLDLQDVRVLLVGGGVVASRKAEGLVAAGATITVVAPEIRPELAEVAVRVELRPYRSTDLAGHRLVMTATDDAAVNAQVAFDARVAGLWVNSADDPVNCSFILPAVARRGPVVVSVGTDGASPALARHLRDRIAAEVLTAEVELAADDLAQQRAEVHAERGSTEDIDWTVRVQSALEQARRRIEARGSW
jgi:siroheme synthase-like protein